MDIFEKIKNGDYVTKLTHPYATKPRRPILCQKHTAEDAEKYAIDLKVYGKMWLVYDAGLKAWRDDRYRLSVLFKKDALEYCGLTDHPKADQAWNMAQEFSDGDDDPCELVQTLEEIANLMSVV